MENNSIKFDKDTPAIVAANKVQSLMAVNKDTGEVGNVEFPLLVQEAGKHVADAVKVTGDVLPTLGDVNKRYSFTTGSAGRTLTYGSTSLVFGANKQCSAFWDGVAKVWTKEDEVDLPSVVIGDDFGDNSAIAASQRIVTTVNNRLVESENALSPTIEEEQRYIIVEFTQGGISTSGAVGAAQNVTNRIRTLLNSSIHCEAGVKLTVNVTEGWKYDVFFYTENTTSASNFDSVMSKNTWYTSVQEFEFIEDRWVRIVLAKIDDTDILPPDGEGKYTASVFKRTIKKVALKESVDLLSANFSEVNDRLDISESALTTVNDRLDISESALTTVNDRLFESGVALSPTIERKLTDVVLELVEGSVDSTGLIIMLTNRVRNSENTILYCEAGDKLTVDVAEDWRYNIFFYTKSTALRASLDSDMSKNIWYTSTQEFEFIEDRWVRIVLAKIDDTDILPPDGEGKYTATVFKRIIKKVALKESVDLLSANFSEVNDRLVESENALSPTIEEEQRYIIVEFTQGGISTSGGTGSSQNVTNRIRTLVDSSIHCEAGVKLTVDVTEGWKYGVFFYTENTTSPSSFDSDMSKNIWYTSVQEFEFIEDRWVRIVLAKIDNTDILPSDGEGKYTASVFKRTIKKVALKESVELTEQSLEPVLTLYDNFKLLPGWVIGGLDSTTGKPANTPRLRSEGFFPLDKGSEIEIEVEQGWKFALFIYDYNSSNSYIQSESVPAWQINKLTYITQGKRSIRVVISRTDNVAISPDDASENFIININGRFTKTILSAEDLSIKLVGGGAVFEGVADPNWAGWLEDRYSFGMNINTTPVPTRTNTQFISDGTIINSGVKSRLRWGFHVFEGYANDSRSRITMLVNKHIEEGRPVAEMYYYLTAYNHSRAAYGWFRIGSDVKDHSFLFGRDQMISFGEHDFRSVVSLASIDPVNDLNRSRSTVESVDSAFEAENRSVENAQSLLYLALKNARNGAMWYDSVRNKIVAKIDGKWHDVNTTEVPNGVYDF